MTLDISATSPRVQYTVGSSSTSTFAYGFPIFQDADLKVFVGSTLKTLTTHYTVTGAGTTSGGNVVMTTGNEVTNADVTIVRDITIARTTDFPTSGSFQVDSLNTELDTITAVQQELEDDISRSLKLSDEDATATLTLPLKDARKGRYLAFNATTGNAEAGPTQTDATLIATVTSDIATLADIQDGTTATNAITTLAGIHGNVTTVAGIHGNVTTIATGTTGGNSNLTNLNTIATGTTGGNANLTQINAVAGKVTEIGRLGTADAVADMALLGLTDVIADMALLADSAVIADMAQLANSDIIADMAQLANSTIIDDLAILANSTITDDMALLAVTDVIDDMALLADSTVITNMANLNASGVITNMANLNASGVLTNIANLNASGVLTNIANLNASGVLTNIANLNATDVITNIGTVASNVSGVNSFAERYRIASSAPTSSLDVGDLYFDTTANELKVYKSSGWSAAGSTVNGTSARFHYNISGTPNSVTGADANGNTLAYDAGFADVYVNGVRMSPDDITITSGTSVVFASALADGDDVDIVAFGTFQVANIVSTGALNSGSITSGFGNIDTGSSTITTTGAISGGTLTGTLQTASQPNITSVGTLTGLTVGDNAGGDVNLTTNSQAGSQASPLNMDINFKGFSNNIMAIIRSHDESSSTGHGELQFFTTKSGVGNTQKMVIDHDGNVGIGTTSPAQLLHVKANNPGGKIRLEMGQAGVANTDVTGEIQFYHNDASVGAGVNADIKGICTNSFGAGALTFGTGTTSTTERMRIASNGDVTVSTGNLVIGTSGKGIDFSATGDGTTMSSELFSDYEEGMWNATLAPQTSGSITVAGGTDACQYTRIGKMVFLSGMISIDSVSSPNGVLRMSGFPYAVANLDDFGGRSLATINIQAGAIPPNNYGMWLNEGDSHGSIYNFTDSEQPQSGASANFSGNESIYFSIMYRTS